MTLPGTGFAPAPTIAKRPQSVIIVALMRPTHARRPNVRGSDNANVAHEKITSSTTAQRPLLDKVERLCCPDNATEPCTDAVHNPHLYYDINQNEPTEAKIANMMDPADRTSRPTGPKMM